MKQQTTLTTENLAMRVSTHTLLGNIGLSLGKLWIGLIAHSGALVSDAIHSASDVITTIIVMIGIRASEKSPDPEHPYGHERFECVFSMVLAGLLLLVGCVIGYHACLQVLGISESPVPEKAALAAAAVSIFVKEAMYHYTVWAAKKLHSLALKADAWHHRSDAFSSIGSFIGIWGARMGYPRLDAVASMVICLFIWKVAYDIFKEAFAKVVDTSCPPEVMEQMRTIILQEDGVLGVDLLNTRMFGAKVYVDVEIRADGTLSLEDAHAIAENVHRAIEKHFEDVKHCMVHVNPAKMQ